VYGNCNLQQCVRDAQAMYDLASRRDMKPHLMVDKRCSKQLVQGIFRNLAEAMKPGDTLFYTHSGHGTYTDLKDGTRATGLCLHDDILWDYEQIPMWKQFKAGTKIIRLADTCFSESNFRLPSKFCYLRTRSLTWPNIKVSGPKPTRGSLRSVPCSIISYSSSNVNQPSYENNAGGIFTQAVEEILNLGTPTYSQLLNAVRLVIQRWDYPQLPQLESSKAGNFKNKPFLT
jgi:hypothetical protein